MKNESILKDITYRRAQIEDSLQLSVLFKQVYIKTYGTEGVTLEFAEFITKQFAVERIEELIREDADQLIIALYKGNPVGIAQIEFSKAAPLGGIVAPELNKLYILDWFCGMGIGEGLLKECEQVVAARGVAEMWLWVYILNERAISFYEKQGYRCIGNAFFQMKYNKYENKVMHKMLNSEGVLDDSKNLFSQRV